MMPRIMCMYNEKHLPGLHFCGGHAMRGSGYNSSYQSDLYIHLTQPPSSCP